MNHPILSIIRHFQRANTKKLFRKAFDTIMIFSMLLSTAPLPVRADNFASGNGQHGKEQTSLVKQASVNDITQSPTPVKRPVVNRPEPRKASRPTDEPVALAQMESPTPVTATPVLTPSAPVSLMFIENAGQFDAPIKFQVQGQSDLVNFTQNDFTITLVGTALPASSSTPEMSSTPTPTASSAGGSQTEGNQEQKTDINFKFLGAQVNPSIHGFKPIDTTVSFFGGNSSQDSHSNVPVWGGIRYTDIYPGVDLVVSGEGGQWSWQLVVTDEARFAAMTTHDKQGIILHIQGATGLSLDQDTLQIKTDTGAISMPIPQLSQPNLSGGGSTVVAQLIGDDLIIIPTGVEITATEEITSTATPTTTLMETATPTVEPSTTLAATDTATPVQQSSPTQTLSLTKTVTPEPSETPAPAQESSPTQPLPPTVTATTAPIDIPTPDVTQTASGEIPTVAPTSTQEVRATASLAPIVPASPTPSDISPTATPAAAQTGGQTPGISSQFDFTAYHPAAASAGRLLFSTNSDSSPIGPIYSSYLTEFGNAITVDKNYAMYIVVRGGTSIFKLNPSGNQADYIANFGSSTYISDIAVDNESNVYITGSTNPADFPTTPGAFNRTIDPTNRVVFVAKLNSLGTLLTYSTFIGAGSGTSLAVDRFGNGYVTGVTSNANFPTTTGAYNRTIQGYLDVFVVKLNLAGSQLLFSTLIGNVSDYYIQTDALCTIPRESGGCKWNELKDIGSPVIAIDAMGAAYVAGATSSSNFPTTEGTYQREFYSSPSIYKKDTFVFKLRPDGSDLVYSTFLGTDGFNTGASGIAVDAAGAAYVTGITTINDHCFSNGTCHSYLDKVQPNGKSLKYAMLISGNGQDVSRDVAVDSNGAAYVVGDTTSTNFLVSTDAFQSSLHGFTDSFILKAKPDGSGLTYSSYVGGVPLGGYYDEDVESGYGLAIDQEGSVYVTGVTTAGTFPTSANAFIPSSTPYAPNGFFYGGFVSKFDFGTYKKVPEPAKRSKNGCPCLSSTDKTVKKINDPIDTSSGVFSDSFEELPMITSAGSLSFTLWYSSSPSMLADFGTLMGTGWTNNHEVRLMFEPGLVTFKSPSANQFTFTDNGYGDYTASAGTLAKLKRVGTDSLNYTYTLTDTSSDVYTFNNRGLITSWTDALGHSWTYTYDGSRLLRVSDDTGQRYLEFGYDPQNRIHTVTEHAESSERTLTLSYNGNDMASMSDPLGQIWHFTYDGAHHLRIVTDPGGAVVVHTEYDVQGRAFTQIDDQGHQVTLTYNDDNTTDILTGSGGKETDIYGGRDTIDTSVRPDGSSGQAMTMYDGNFRPLSSTDGSGNNTQMAWTTDGAHLTSVINPEKDTISMLYNDPFHPNNLTGVIDESGNLTTYTYDSTHPTLLASSQDPFGNTTTYTYTTAADAPQPAGLLKEIDGPNPPPPAIAAHLRTTFTYDMFGQRLSMTDPQGKTTTYTYTAFGQTQSVTDPTGHRTWTCYDAAGRVIRSVANASGDGSTPQKDPCDAANYQPSSDPTLDRISLTHYDASGNVDGSSNPDGVVARTYYDSLSRVRFVTQNLKDPANLDADFDQLMALAGRDGTTATPPAYDQAHPDQNVSTETEYDADGNTVANIDANGVITRTYYDAYRRVMAVTRNLRDPSHPDASVSDLLSLPEPPAATTANPDWNLTTKTVYDAAGNSIATVDPAGRITRTYTDGDGRVRFVVQNLDPHYDIQKDTPPDYNPANPDMNVRTETQYVTADYSLANPTGNKYTTTLTIDPRGTKTLACYDALGRVERTVVNPSVTGQAPCTPDFIPNTDPAADRITDTVYDAGGNAIATINPVGMITRTYYDGKGRQAAVTANLRDPVNPDASFDALMALETPPAYEPAHPDWNVTTRTVYDDITGQTIATIDARGAITRTYFDAQNRPYMVVQNLTGQAVTDATAPAFDPAHPDQNIHSQTVYDNTGTPIATIANDGAITRSYFDQLHRTIMVVKNLTGQDVSVTMPPIYDPAHPDQNVLTQTVYDAAGNAFKTIDAAGQVAYTCYDGAGRAVKTVANPSVSNPCGNYTLSTSTDQDISVLRTYDAGGNRLTSTDASNKKTYYTYDGLNRLIQQTDPLNQAVHFEYDLAGNQISKMDAKGIVTRYSYDVLSELVSVTENYVSGGGVTNEQNVLTTYTYDKLGNRVGITDALNHTTTFTYDALNRLLSETDALGHATTYGYDADGNKTSLVDANGATTSYTYDGLNRPSTISYPAPEAQVSFTYDAAGNRKTMGDATGLTEWQYDKLNRPTDVTQPQTGTVHYGYDAAGNRTSLTYPDNKTVNYTYDTAGRLHLVTSWDSLVTTYTFDRSSRVTERALPNNVTSAYTYDAAGNLLSLSHTAGDQTLSSFQYTYDENGNRTAVNETLAPAGGQAPDLIFADGFESGDLSAWSSSVTDGGRLSVTDGSAILGAKGMAADVTSTTPVYVTEQMASALAGYNARFYFNPNSVSLGTGDPVVLYRLLDASSNSLAQIELRRSAGDYQVRGGAIDDSGAWHNTDWKTISNGVHALELDWRAATAAGTANGSLAFFVDGTQSGALNAIANPTRQASSVQLGAVAVNAATQGTLYFDGFESHAGTLVGLDPNGPTNPGQTSQDELFTDGFESGSLSAWSSSETAGGQLNVSAQASIAGAQGMQVTLPASGPAFARDDSPSNETHYRARFYVDTNTLRMADGDSFDLFHASNRGDQVVVKVEFRNSNGRYQVRASTQDDTGKWYVTAWSTISNGPHALEFAWRAASANGANDGGFNFWIDQTQKGETEGLDNDTRRVDYAQLGVVSAPPAGSSGALYFDAFASHRDTFVGPEAGARLPANPPTPDDAIFADGFESGDLFTWSSSNSDGGHLSATSQAAIVGSHGMQATVDGTSPMFVTDGSPDQEKRYRARFYFNPNGIVLSNGIAVALFDVYSKIGLSARIALRSSGDYYQTQALTVDDSGIWHSTTWFGLTNAVHAVEIDWQAATTEEAGDGRLAFWVDGILKFSLMGIGNVNQAIDYTHLGLLSGLTTGASGMIYFDGFVAHRTTPIGLDPSLPGSTIFGDGFESGNLSAWSSSVTDNGHLSVDYLHPIVGGYALKVAVNDDNPLYVADTSPTAEPRYRARFYFNPNSIQMADGDSFYLFQGLDADSNPLMRIELGYKDGSYELRSRLINIYTEWTSTRWIDISDTTHAIEFDWQAASTYDSADGSLSFWVDGNEQGSVVGAENADERVETGQLGAVGSIDDTTRGEYYLDAFESSRANAIGQDTSARTTNEVVLSEGFESGNIAPIVTGYNDNRATVTTTARIIGNYGLQIMTGRNSPDYLRWLQNSGNKAQNVRFYFDPNSINMAEGDSFYVLGLSGSYLNYYARIGFARLSGQYRIRAEVKDDSGQWHNTHWFVISDGPHAIELDLRAASAVGANNGRADFLVDDRISTTANLAGIDNDTFISSSVELGIDSTPNNTTMGTIYIDGLVSTTEGTIGLDPASLIPPLPDTIFTDGFESGDLSAWSSSQVDGGKLSVTSGAAISESYGLQANLGDGNPLQVTDWSLLDESSYRTRFYFDPNGFTNTSSDPVDIFNLRNLDGSALEKIVVRVSGGQYQIQAQVFDDANTAHSTGWFNITNGPHPIEIDWGAATPDWAQRDPGTLSSAGKGWLTWFVDGIYRGNINSLSNGARLADYATLGLPVNPATAAGTLYFDNFVSTRSGNFIGFDPDAPAPRLFSNGFENGDLSAWSSHQPGNAAGLTVTNSAAIVGAKGLQITVTDNTPRYVADSRLNAEKRYRARFYFDPNAISMGNGDQFTIFSAPEQADIELRFMAGDYQVRSVIHDDNATQTPSAWVTILDGPHALELDWNAAWSAGSGDGYLHFWVDGNQVGNINGINNATGSITIVQIGALGNIPGTTRGSLYFDGFESRYIEYIGLDPNALPAPTQSPAIFIDGFEGGTLSEWAGSETDDGHLSVTSQAAIVGGLGMRAAISDTNLMYVTDESPADETHYRARFYFDPNSVTMADWDSIDLYEQYGEYNTGTGIIKLFSHNGKYYLQLFATDSVHEWIYSSWTLLTDGPHALEVDWRASSSAQASDGSMTLWIDGIQSINLSGLANDQDRVNSVRLGVVSAPVSTTSGTVYFDGFVSQRSAAIGLDPNALPAPTLPEAIFSDGIESGDLTAWSKSETDNGNLSVSAQAAIVGSQGMQAVISDTNPMYVTDNSPMDETRYRARFYFDPNSVSMAEWDSIDLYEQYGWYGNGTGMIRMDRQNGKYYIQIDATDSTYGWVGSSWKPIADGPHAFEVDWRASSSAQASDGSMTLWIDGIQALSLTGLANDQERVNFVRLGVVSAPVTTTSGVVYFDGFVSQRSAAIGLDPNALPAPAMGEAIFSDGFESGDLSAWSMSETDSGNLSVSAQAAILGSQGMQAGIRDTNPMYVTDTSPMDETHYRARFYFDPNNVTMGYWDGFDFFSLNYRNGDEFGRLTLFYYDGTYHIQMATTGGDGWHYSPLAPFSDEPHAVEIDWRAASASNAADGEMTLWIDGAQAQSITGLTNGDDQIDYARLGVLRGASSTTYGMVYFDGFVSQRSAYIGPDQEALSGQKPVARAKAQPAASLIPGVYHPQYPLAIVGDYFPSLKPVGDILSDVPVSRTITYTYDPLNRLTAANDGDGTFFDYTYDAVGNRLTQTTKDGTTAYTYDAANRLSSVGGESYSWDANGNLLSDGTSVYTYDSANRLASVTTGGTTYQYAYNGNGDRVAQVVGGTTTRYTLDSENGLTQVLADGTDTYLYGNERIAQQDSTGTGYFLGDALGSVRQLVDDTGTVTLSRQYDPFGNVIASTGTGTTSYGFDAEWSDALIGLIYLRARYYSSNQGRFISHDPWDGDQQQPMSYNAWVYVYENPINQFDPGGKDASAPPPNYDCYTLPKSLQESCFEQPLNEPNKNDNNGNSRIYGGSEIKELYEKMRDDCDAWWNRNFEWTDDDFFRVFNGLLMITEGNSDDRLTEYDRRAVSQQMFVGADLPPYCPYGPGVSCRNGMFNFWAIYSQSAQGLIRLYISGYYTKEGAFVKPISLDNYFGPGSVAKNQDPVSMLLKASNYGYEILNPPDLDWRKEDAPSGVGNDDGWALKLNDNGVAENSYDRTGSSDSVYFYLLPSDYAAHPKAFSDSLKDTPHPLPHVCKARKNSSDPVVHDTLNTSYIFYSVLQSKFWC